MTGADDVDVTRQAALCNIIPAPAQAFEYRQMMAPQVTKVVQFSPRVSFSTRLAVHDDDDGTDYYPDTGHHHQLWDRRVETTTMTPEWITNMAS
jgi:hypothetical protein